MKVRVKDNCISCGLCASMSPDVFLMTNGGTAGVVTQEIGPELEPQARAAADSCPVSAIETE